MSGLREEYTCDAVVLSVRDAGLAHRQIELFTRQRGRLTCLAYNARKSQNPLGGMVQPPHCLQVQILETRGLRQIRQAEIIHSFRPLQEDLVRFSCAGVLLELVRELWAQEQTDAEAFDRLLNILTTLEQRNPRLTLLAGGWQLLAAAGFEPQLEHCTDCGAAPIRNRYFSCKQGGVVCKNCRQERDPACTERQIGLLQRLLELNWRQPPEFSVALADMAMLESLFDLYVCCYLERPLRSLSVLRQLTDGRTIDTLVIT